MKSRKLQSLGSNNSYTIVCLLVLLLIISSFQIYIHYISPPLYKIAESVKSRLSSTFAEIIQEDVKAKAFDWKAYILIHPDLVKAGILSQDAALNHLKQYGNDEGRAVPLSPIANPSFTSAIKRLETMIALWDQLHVPHEFRYLLVYYAKTDKQNDSIDVLRNNFQLFSSALSRGNYTFRHQVFYWINVADYEKNPLSNLIRESGAFSESNAAIIDWNYDGNEVYNFLFTLKEIPIALKSKIGYLLFVTTDVRGPIRNRASLDWMVNIDYLIQLGKVALVGNEIKCASTAYLSYPLVTSSGYWQIFEQSLLDKNIVELNSKLNLQYLSNFFVNNGYLIASTTLLRRGLNPLLSSVEINCTANSVENMLTDSTSEFLTWQPSVLHDSNYLLSHRETDIMKDILSTLSKEENIHHRKLASPEVLRAGMRVDFYRQYEREKVLPILKLAQGDLEKPKVCFVVRTAALNDNDYKVNGTMRGSVQELINCKLQFYFFSLARSC